MEELSECPECGGPLIVVDPADIRCVNCGATFIDGDSAFDGEDFDW